MVIKMLDKISTDLDLYLEGTSEMPCFSKVVILNEHEYGSASYLAMRSIIGKQKPIGRFISKMIGENVFNTVPDTEEIGWPMYIHDGTLFLLLSSWPPTPVYPPDAASGTWIYIYPVVRDIVTYLQGKGCEEIIFLTSATLHEVLSEDFPELSNNRVYQWRWNESKGTRKSLFLPPPAWLFCYLGSKLGIDSRLFTTGHDSDKTVDIKAGKTLAGGISKHLNKSWGIVNFDTAVDEISTLHDKINEMKSVALENARDKPAVPNQMLWG